MDTMLLPSRSVCPAISSLCCKGTGGSTQGRSDRVLLPRSSSRLVQTNLLLAFKVDNQRTLTYGNGRRNLALRATLATEEEGVHKFKFSTEEEVVDETKLATAEEEVADAAPSESASDNAVSRSVALLKTAAKTRKVSASEICAAFRFLELAKFDPTDFLSIIGGTKSPGRTWLLVFTSGKDDNMKGKRKYFPITAVQNFDAEAKKIENGVFLGPLGELTFTGNFIWEWPEKRKLAFIFHTLNFRIGPLGPFHIGIGSKDKEITGKDPFFIWYYADDEIIVGKGRAGGTAYWVRCARVKKSPF